MDNSREEEWNRIVNTVYEVVKEKKGRGVSYDNTLSKVLKVAGEYEVICTEYRQLKYNQLFI